MGRAIAARFAAEGDVVVITGRNADRLRRAADELGTHGIVCDAAHLIAAAQDRRPGRPGDIADTALFLASPGAGHITGQTIHVNGGAFTTR